MQDIIQKRQNTITSLVTSYDAYDDLLAKANKGIEFYTKLETNVTKLLQRIRGACKVQQEEREQMLSKTETPKSEYIPPAVPASTTPKLKDYLEARKKNTVSAYDSAMPQYPAANYSVDAPTWSPGVRPAPLGSEVNDPLPSANTQEAYNYSNTAQYYNQAPTASYSYPASNMYSSQTAYNPADSRQIPYSSVQAASYNTTDSSIQNQGYNTQEQRIPAPQIPTDPTAAAAGYSIPDASVDYDLSNRMKKLLGSSQSTANTPYNPQQYSYSSYTPQNYSPSYSFQSNSSNTTTPSQQQQSYEYDPTKAYTSTTNSYQPISSHTPGVASTYYPTSNSYTASSDSASYLPTSTSGYASQYGTDASSANNSYQNLNNSATGSYQNPTNYSTTVNPPVSSTHQSTNTPNYQTPVSSTQTYQYPSSAYNQYNTYYPPGYAPGYTNQTGSASDYSTQNYHTHQYATSVQPNCSAVNNSTYSSPTVATSSSNSSTNETGQQYNYPQNYQQYPYANQTSEQTQTPGAYLANPNYSSYSYYQTQNYNTQQGYGQTTPTPQTPQPVQTPQPSPAPAPTKVDSNIDLLTGLDFSINQTPLVPQNSVSTSSSLQPEPPKQDVPVKTTTVLEKSTPEVQKPKTPQVKILPSKPLNNEEVKKLFSQEVEKFEKFVDVLPNKTLSGPTNLDLKWKEIQDKQDTDGQRKIISVARCYPMKNRFPDILPYDACRVELVDSKDDYINASFIKVGFSIGN